MSRKYLNERWCVRCSRTTPTPFLKEMWEKYIKPSERCSTEVLYKRKCVIDVGCGNGRNTAFFKKKGLTVDSLDMVGDCSINCILGKDKFPDKTYDITLANYVLMFLNQKERYHVMKQIQEHTGVGSILIIEMYPAKDAYPYNMDKINHYFERRKWSKVVNRKDRSLLVKKK